LKQKANPLRALHIQDTATFELLLLVKGALLVCTTNSLPESNSASSTMVSKAMIYSLLLSHMQRRLPSPGFQVEVVILGHDAPISAKVSEGAAAQSATTGSETPATSFSEREASQEGTGLSSLAPNAAVSRNAGVDNTSTGVEEQAKESEMGEGPSHPEKIESHDGNAENKAGAQPENSFNETTESLSRHDENLRNNPAVAPSDFKAIAAASAADASVFTFGEDDEDYDSGEEQQ
jgi:phosphatidylinositol-3,4,5-trisphosphate 3-phosphatase/dual-specificity protein phosphatase PTEN